MSMLACNFCAPSTFTQGPPPPQCTCEYARLQKLESLIFSHIQWTFTVPSIKYGNGRQFNGNMHTLTDSTHTHTHTHTHTCTHSHSHGGQVLNFKIASENGQYYITPKRRFNSVQVSSLKSCRPVGSLWRFSTLVAQFSALVAP